MTAEIGLFFLIIALFASLVQASFLLPAPRLHTLVAPCLLPAAWLQALCVTLAFATLVTLRLNSDFSVEGVIAHSNLALPTLYKVAGTWGYHEGSMLLWVWVLAAFGIALSCGSMSDNPGLKKRAMAMQALLAAGFLLFIILTSNPFARHFPPTVDGESLNPLLQDMAMTMHPPLLYLGYVGFSIVFSLAVAAMLQGRMGREWAESVHPWIMAAWACLTCGIGLGSWWAYRVLGWGGFWFWDPVENASLLPWLAGTALLHSNIVLKKRGLLAQWVLLLAIITFALSLLGTFLVRSGVLVSVHSFASDPMRGFFIMGYIVLMVGGALLLFGLRAGALASEEEGMLPLTREGMIVVNNLFVLTACATVLLGTLYPLLAELMHSERLTVGPPYFNRTFIPLMVLPLILAGIAPLVGWKKADLVAAWPKLKPAAMASGAAALLALAISRQQWLLGMLGFALAAWLFAGSLNWLRHRGWAKGGAAVFMAHAGAAVLVAGITGACLWKQEIEFRVKPGDVMDIAGYHLTYLNEKVLSDPNYTGRAAELVSSDYEVGLTPEYRVYSLRKSATSVASIHHTATGDLYAVIGETSEKDQKTAIRVYFNPMIGWIWAGFMLMGMAGFFAIFQHHVKRRVDHTF